MRLRMIRLLGIGPGLILLAAACSPAPRAPTDRGAPPTTRRMEGPTAEPMEPTEVPTPALPGEGVTVRPLKATWDTGWFQEAIYASLLEELGYTVEPAQAVEEPMAYQLIAAGEADFWANGWFPLHDTFLEMEPVAEEVTKVGLQVEAGVLQGYLVNKSAVDEEGIASLTDLADPEVAALFDFDDDGLADLYGCPPAWTCHLEIEGHLDEFNLRHTVAHVDADYAAGIAHAMSRFERGENILFHTWTPNWTLARLVPGEDVMWINTPGPTGIQAVDGVTGCVTDPCELGWEAHDIRVVANRQFLAEHPAAERLFELAEIPMADINAQNLLMFEGEDSGQDFARHAEAWIRQNRGPVNRWLEAAKAAAK